MSAIALGFVFFSILDIMDPHATSSDPDINPEHMAKAVTELGEKQTVLTSCAIFNEQGAKIIDQGVAINKSLYERLTQHRLSTPVENSVTSANAVTGDALRRDAQAILDHLPVYGRMAEDAKTRALMLDAIKAMPLPAPMALQLTIARDLHPGVYQHLLRTALGAAWLSIAPLVPRFDVNAAAMAGMLHDIGMLHVDPLLIDSGDAPNREQQRQLFAHPLVSTALIERHHQYPKEVVRAVREHHEYLDGTGYPRSLSGEAISPLGRKLALAQLMSATLTRTRNAPEMRLSVLLRMNTHHYDATVMSRILRLLKPETRAESFSHVQAPLNVVKKLATLLAQWPETLSQVPERKPHQRGDLLALSSQGAQLQRCMANAGLVPDQIEQLGDDLDESLRLEISLLIREAAWQMRTLARQARQHWALDNPSDAPPDAIHAWADTVETAVGEVIGQAPMNTETPPAKANTACASSAPQGNAPDADPKGADVAAAEHAQQAKQPDASSKTAE